MGPPDAFQVCLARSGRVLDVGPGESILDVIEAHGVRVPTSCRSGVCSRCTVRVLKGEIEHRDWWMSPEEQDAQDQIAVCCSRALSRLLVLDL